MSLYNVVVNCTGVGRAGSSKVLVIGFFPHISEAKQRITKLMEETFVGPMNIDIDFISHSNTIFATDVLPYERIMIME